MHLHTINTRPYFSPATILAKNRTGDKASSFFTLSMLATLVGFVVTCCRVFIDNSPAMNLAMQRRATLQSGESLISGNVCYLMLAMPTERN